MNFGSKKETKGSLHSEHPNLNSEIEKQNRRELTGFSTT